MTNQEEVKERCDVSGLKKMSDYITQSLIQRYGEQNTDAIKRYVSKYKLIITKDMLDVYISELPHSYHVGVDDVKVFHLEAHKERWGRLRLNGVMTWMNTPLSHILCDIKTPGKTGVATAVTLKEIVMDSLTQFAIEENTDFVWKLQQDFDFDTQNIFGSKIDKESLRRGILDFEYKSTIERDPKKKGKLIRDIAKGKAILNSLTKEDELLQEMSEADSGRIYFKGLNLQNSSKALRHAALGRCHLYDLRCGSYGVMAGLAKEYASIKGIETDFINIRGYLKNKESFRQRVTEYVYPYECKNFNDLSDYKGFFGWYNVKQALTAIGFGAKRNTSSIWQDINGDWQKTSLLSAFKGNKNEAERFADCGLIQSLIDEYVDCGNVVDMRLQEDQEFRDTFRITDGMSKGQRLAMVYQSTEAKILTSFMQSIENNVLLLPAHDGIYVKHRIDYPSLHFKIKTPYIKDKSYIQFDHTQYGLASIAHEIEHKQLIGQQERIAQSHIPINSNIDGRSIKKQIMTQFGLIDEDIWNQHNSQDTDEYYQDTYIKESYTK